MPQKYNDQQLLLLLCNDPESGLAALLDAYGTVINTVVRRILHASPQDAEECVADTLVAAWRSAPALQKKRSPLKGWLCLTARNLAINRWHSVKRRTTGELDEEMAGDWMLAPRTSDAEDQIEALVNALPPPDKEIFIRRYYLLEPSKEIGKALGMEEHTVNVRLSRGRAKLRQQFLAAKEGTSYA